MSRWTRMLALVAAAAAWAPAGALAQTPVPPGVVMSASQAYLARSGGDRRSAAAEFTLDACSFVSISVIAGAHTRVIVRDPLGEEWPGTVTPRPGGPADPADGVVEHLFVRASPAVGTYAVVIDGDGADVDVGTPAVLVESDGALRAGAFVRDPDAQAGLPAVAVAALFGGAGPVAGADVTATVRAPSGAIADGVLHDDGREPDAAAGDGLYSFAFVPAEAGEYGILMRARGTDAGLAFERRAATSLLATRQPARIEQFAGARTLPPARDGAGDTIELTASIGPATDGRFEPGDYRIVFELATDAGSRLLVSGSTRLDGPGSIAASVDRRRAGREPMLRRITLLRVSPGEPRRADLLDGLQIALTP